MIEGKIKNAPFNHENKINATDNWKIKIMPQIIEIKIPHGSFSAVELMIFFRRRKAH